MIYLNQRNIGIKLRKLRLEKGYTQQKVADHLDITPNAVSSYENGDTTPSLKIFVELMKLYDSSADAVLGLNCIESSDLDSEQDYFFREMIPKLRKIITG